MPLIGLDLNDNLGLQKQGRWWQPSFDRHVGRFMPGQEHYASQELRKLMLQYDLAAINTHVNAGYTFFGNGGMRSRIDFLVGPVHMLHAVQSCSTLGRLGKQLQAIRVRGFRDHLPLHCRFGCGSLVATMPSPTAGAIWVALSCMSDTVRACVNGCAT